MNSSKLIKLLVVDDSAFMRKAISNMVESDPVIKVVGTARDGMEGIEKIRELKPDIVTLDIEMPRMNGLEALKIIMEKMPLPVLVVSSVNEDEAKAALDALDMGAVDFIPKNLADVSLNIMKLKNGLVEKIKEIVSRKDKFLAKIKQDKKTPSVHRAPIKHETILKQDNQIQRVRVVAIGTSTGGPKALQEVLPLLPKDFPCGVLVVQHMPTAFIGHFSERLNQMSQMEVKMAEQNDVIRPGLALIAPGDYHMRAAKKSPTEVVIDLTKYPSDSLHRPSVDVMMQSVAETFGGRSLAVMMTGMGHDGKDGMKMIKEKNGRTIAQDEESCVVYGMPRAVIELDIVDKIVSLPYIAGEIINMV